MRKWFVIMLSLGFCVAVQSPSLSSAEQPVCASTDKTCQAFARMAEREQFDDIIAQVDPKRTYSEAARNHIGLAYLTVAGRETNTQEQEEAFCLKAIEYGAVSAYMGLYFIHAENDAEKALGYLKQYIATQPQDSVPYVILGEAELEKGNYAAASDYLLAGAKVAHGTSSNLDWLLFQSSYLIGDYDTAAGMLDRSFSHGKTAADLKALVTSDPRFSELAKRKEFMRFAPIINGTNEAKAERKT